MMLIRSSKVVLILTCLVTIGFFVVFSRGFNDTKETSSASVQQDDYQKLASYVTKSQQPSSSPVIHPTKTEFKASKAAIVISTPNNSNKQTVIDNLRRLSDVVKSTPSYQAALPDYQNGAITNQGNSARLEYALLKAVAETTKQRKQLHFVAVGGTITAGYGLKPKSDYFSVLGKWLQETFKAVDVTVKFDNIAMPGSASNYYSKCIGSHLNLTDVDVLVVEFRNEEIILNSGNSDELIRAIWRVNPNIHIIYVDLLAAKIILRAQLKEDFYDFALGSYGAGSEPQLMQRFEIPVVQWSHIFGHLAFNVDNEKLPIRSSLARDFSLKDLFHPGEVAHRYMAEFIFAHLQRNFQHLADNLAVDRRQSMDDILSSYPTSIDKSWERVRQPQQSKDFQCFATKPPTSSQHHDDETECSNINSEVGFTYFSLPSKIGSFVEFNFANNIQPTTIKCSGSYYISQFGISYRMCPNCTADRSSLNAKIQLSYSDSTKTIENVTYNLGLTSLTGDYDKGAFLCKNDVVLAATTPQQKETFCGNNKSQLQGIHVRLEQTTDKYPVSFSSLIISYECC